MTTIRKGRIEAITGPMFSSKTETLIARIHRATYAKQTVLMFKPIEDTRSGAAVVSHSQKQWPAINIPANLPEQIFAHIEGVQVVGIDEIQFFSPNVIVVVRQLADSGIRVIVAGLDKDATDNPFGPMPLLLAIADRIDKLTGVCTVCGEDATCSQSLMETLTPVAIGAADKYAARCRDHFTPVKFS